MLDSSDILASQFLLVTSDLSKSDKFRSIAPNAEVVHWEGLINVKELAQAQVSLLAERGCDIVVIAHRPPLDATLVAERIRNCNGGKELYIVVVVPADVDADVGGTSDVDDFLYLAGESLEGPEFQHCVSRYNRKVKSRNEFVTAARTAKNAIESASEYGSLIHFFEASENCSGLLELKDMVAEFLQARKLSADFLISSGEDPLFFLAESHGPSHRSMLEHLRSSEKRIVSADKLLGFNFDHFSLLISNAPHEQPEKYGQIKDTLAHFCTIAESRVKSLCIKASIAQQHERIVQIMDLIRQSSADAKLHINNIMKTLVSEIELTANTFDMNLAEEEKLLEIANSAALDLGRFHDTNQLVESHFINVVKTLSEMKELAFSEQAPIGQGEAVELF